MIVDVQTRVNDRCTVIQKWINLTLDNNQRHPEYRAIADRVSRASSILNSNLLNAGRPLSEPGSCVGEIATCGSQSEPGVIHPIFGGGFKYLVCGCWDYRKGVYRHEISKNGTATCGAPKLVSGQIACKHILAYMIDLAIKEEADHDNF